MPGAMGSQNVPGETRRNLDNHQRDRAMSTGHAVRSIEDGELVTDHSRRRDVVSEEAHGEGQRSEVIRRDEETLPCGSFWSFSSSGSR